MAKPINDAFKRTVAATRNVTPGDAKLCVLLADDDAALCRSISRDLSKRGYDVTSVHSGAAALEALLAASFDVIVSDIHMPGMSGVDLMRAIRTYDLDVPVLLMTAEPELKTAIQAVELGALQYIEKPVTRDTLVRAVERAARLHKLATFRREAARAVGHDPQAATDRAGLTHQLDRALETLWVAFQPVVKANGGIVGYEALARSDDLSLAAASSLLGAAEKLDRLSELGRKLRNYAAIEFHREAPEDAVLFVNLHPTDLEDTHLAEPRSPLSQIASRVILELSERAALENIVGLEDNVRALKELGFRFAIDDLGAGVAGLNGFALMEPEVIKLDPSLIHEVHLSPVRKRLLGAITMVCKEMGAQVIAEGVETRAERDCADALGCEFFQGYFFAHPGRGFCEGPLDGEDVV